jgi:hypothetical protein
MTEGAEAQRWKHAVNGQATEHQLPSGPEPATQSNRRRLEAPFYYAANAQILISGNDAALLFTRPHPAILPDGTLAPAPLRDSVALIHMSLAGLKEFASAAADVIRRVEERSGEIQNSNLRGGVLSESVLKDGPKS